MRLYELIEQLQELADTCGGDEVLVATQPRHPLAYTLATVWVDDEEGGTVWLALGDHAEDPYCVPEEVWS